MLCVTMRGFAVPGGMGVVRISMYYGMGLVITCFDRQSNERQEKQKTNAEFIHSSGVRIRVLVSAFQRFFMDVCDLNDEIREVRCKHSECHTDRVHLKEELTDSECEEQRENSDNN